jgi:hypothetical protein
MNSVAVRQLWSQQKVAMLVYDTPGKANADVDYMRMLFCLQCRKLYLEFFEFFSLQCMC